MQRFRFSARLVAAGLALAVLAVASVARAQQADRLTPADAGFIVHVDFRQILDAPLIKKNAVTAISAALAKDEAGKVLKAAGLDPLKDIDSLTVTGILDLKKPRGFGVLRGRFDPDKILGVLTEHAKESRGKVEILKEGDLRIVRLEGDKPAFAAFADAKTLIIAPEKSDLTEVIGRVSKAPERLNKDLQAALAKLGGKEALWLAVVISEDLKKALPADNAEVTNLVAPIKAITGGIELTDAVSLSVAVHTADEDSAAAIKKKIDEFLPALNFFIPPDERGKMAKEALSTLKVSTDKNAVRLSLQLTEDLLKKAGEPRKKDKPKDK